MNNDTGRGASTPLSSVSVCGIGASAGGIEALQALFGALPTDLGLAYVVIVHLAPDRKSELPAILARCTDMPVVQVGDHDKAHLEPNHVYVIAPDRKLVVTDTSIGAGQFEQPRGQRTAIDLFFRSLAETHGDGFAVVLSGSGSDGAAGARAVKEHGGLVLVQDPADAAHGSMPRSVIATGVADVVLPVRELAARLSELAHNKGRMRPLLLQMDTAEPTPSSEEQALRQVFELLRRQTGHDFTHYKRNTVMRRLTRRMQLCGRVTIPDYLEQLRTHPEEVRALFDDLLISVTAFFRDPAAWNALQTTVIRPLIEQSAADQQIRLWVPGCSTGEEAYTLAMLVQEEIERSKVAANVLIFASDADEAALAVARAGLYPSAISADVSQGRLERFFRAEDDHYRVVAEVRDRLVFAVHNVLRDAPFSRLHVISCRNLLIYLDRELQEQVMAVFHYALRENGCLFLGASETADEEMFRAVDKRHRIFCSQLRPEGPRPALPEILTTPASRAARHSRDIEPLRRLSAPDAHLIALERVGPPSALTDERWNVLHLSASAAKFLQQGGGPPARRITDLARPELRDELHALMTRAVEQDGPHLSEFVPVAFNGSAHRVAMLAQRHASEGAGTGVLVTFLDAGVASSETSTGAAEPASDATRELRERLRHAERRIDTMREEHHAVNEDLRAANEELQSLNEEYRSTTQELETSKEELQSINEELQTVNNELKLKLEDISRAHSDLENLMAATDLGTLFLDRALRIKRFTPRIAELFSIKTRDIDRPIADLTSSLDYEGFIQDLQEVVARGSSLDRDVRNAQGQSFVVRMSPYRLLDSQAIDGVVATFVDITAIKATEAALRASQQQLSAELETMRRVHEMTMSVATAASTQEALDNILTTAIELQGAEFGNVQLLEADSQKLRIVAHRGFTPSFLEHFRVVGVEDESSCGRTLRSRSMTQIADVLQDPEYAPLRGIAAAAGYRAVQSTPLINREGVLVGVLSVHFRDAHSFNERNRQIGELLGQQAADLIESRKQQDRLEELNAALKERTAELEASQKRLARQAADLLEQDRNRDEFLAALGHELRNPMGAIHNSLAIISVSDPDSQRALEILRRQERHLLRLVNDLLDITRVKHGRIHLERIPVDLGEVARETLETVRAQAERKKLALLYSPPAERIYVEADPERLVQILDNLLRNAVTYTDAGEVELLLSAEPGTSLARVTVRDTGNGIDPQQADGLFKPYQRRTLEQRSGGLGLGLAVARAMVQAHGGTIWYESAGLGKGTQFSFTLPLAQAPEAPVAAAKLAAGVRPRRVLVVDDQQDVADALGGLLKSLGQDVQIAYDSPAALQLARAQPPEAAFIDLSMPGADGVALARALRQMSPHEHLVLVAITGDPAAKASLAGDEFTHALLKPATVADLLRILQ